MTPPPRRHSIVNLVLAAIGGLLLVWTVRSVGWTDIVGGFRALGWWFAPVLGLGGLRFATRARAWQACAAPAALPFRRAFSAMLSADALGNLTPLGLFASEPAKVLFVRGRLDTVAAVSSVAVENAFYIASVLVMIAAGAMVLIARTTLPAALEVGTGLVLVAVAAGALVALWAARRRPAILTAVVAWVTRATGRGAASAERLAQVERGFYAVLSWPLPRLAGVAAFEAVFHIAAVAEVYLVLRVLAIGREASLLDAFVLETTGRLIAVLFKFVPYRLGVDEVGSALVARALGIDPAAAVALALIRRVRVLAWNGVGLGLLARQR